MRGNGGWFQMTTVSTTLIVCMHSLFRKRIGRWIRYWENRGLQPAPSCCLYKCLLCKKHGFMDFVNKRSFFSFKENRFPCHLLLLVVFWQVPQCLWGQENRHSAHWFPGLSGQRRERCADFCLAYVASLLRTLDCVTWLF